MMSLYSTSNIVFSREPTGNHGEWVKMLPPLSPTQPFVGRVRRTATLIMAYLLLLFSEYVTGGLICI